MNRGTDLRVEFIRLRRPGSVFLSTPDGNVIQLPLQGLPANRAVMVRLSPEDRETIRAHAAREARNNQMEVTR